MNYSFICSIILIIFFYNITAISTAHADSSSSIQGKEYENRTNGVYDSSITDKQVEEFLEKAKNSIATRDPDTIANIFLFPFRCSFCKKPIIVDSKKEFIRRYNEIITTDVIVAIQNANINELFVNYQGFMIGRGEIWFDPIHGIITLN